MESRIAKAKQVASRSLRLKCPNCGNAGIYEGFVKIRPFCSACGMIFEREQGYYVGGIYVNVILTEGLLAVAYVISLVAYPPGGMPDWLLFSLAVALPLLFFRHSKSVWLGFDYLVEPPKGTVLPEKTV